MKFQTSFPKFYVFIDFSNIFADFHEFFNYIRHVFDDFHDILRDFQRIFNIVLTL